MSFSLSQNQWWFSALSTIANTPSINWKPASGEISATLSNLFSMFKRSLLTLLIILGSCTLYDQAIGDGTLPRLNEPGGIRELQILAQRNSTAHLTTIPDRQPNKQQGWQALTQSRELLTALSPEMGLWLYQLQKENRIDYPSSSSLNQVYAQAAETTTLAAYDKLSGKLMIHSGFWALSDGEKAAVLAHEYRHSRQNWPKKISIQLAQLITNGQLRYQSQLETEAFDYERQARSALGLSTLQANLPH